jgi:hypothetical protein
MIGKQFETDKYYARDASRQTIFIIDKEIVEKTRRPLFAWRDKSIAPVERDKITEIDIRQPSGSLLIRKAEAEWLLGDGKKVSFDKVSDLLNALEFDKAQDIIDAPANLRLQPNLP